MALVDAAAGVIAGVLSGWLSARWNARHQERIATRQRQEMRERDALDELDETLAALMTELDRFQDAVERGGNSSQLWDPVGRTLADLEQVWDGKVSARTKRQEIPPAYGRLWRGLKNMEIQKDAGGPIDVLLQFLYEARQAGGELRQLIRS